MSAGALLRTLAVVVKCIGGIGVAVSVGVAGCGRPERQEWPNTFDGDGEDAFLDDDDFACLTDPVWTPVLNFKVQNVLGHTLEAVDHAESGALGAYPIGTVLQLFHDEASVKRGRGFSADTDDWEFIKLAVDDDNRTVIVDRGTVEPGNPGGSCISCHGKAAAFDFVCGTNHSCAELPFFINTNPDSAVEDPRCR